MVIYKSFSYICSEKKEHLQIKNLIAFII